MLRSDFLKEISFDDSNVKDTLSDVNYRQIIPIDINVGIWEVTYKYTTVRDNEKTGKKYITLPYMSYDLVENTFYDYIDRYNRENPSKQISNVEILDTEYIGDCVLSLE